MGAERRVIGGESREVMVGAHDVDRALWAMVKILSFTLGKLGNQLLAL